MLRPSIQNVLQNEINSSTIMGMTMTFSEIIELWPSAPEMAEGINKFVPYERRVSAGTIRAWKGRNSIPAWYLLAVFNDAKRRKLKVTAMMLFEAAAV
jgi:hypothetical protein